MNKAALEALLQGVPDFAEPQARLEQYRTPATVATALLWEAHQEAAIAGKDVLDLGCGTGMFCVGADALGAASVTGVDMDPGALAIACSQVDGTFIEARIGEWQASPVDTVFMNPPFGAQFKGADRPFYATAADATRDRQGTTWFLAQTKTERFLGKEIARHGAHLERVLDIPYPIEARFDFHDKRVHTIQVSAYRMGWD